MDLVRVLITGPVDTPYSRGCFVFDVYYPSTFPANPPIVIMITTGGGTVRCVAMGMGTLGMTPLWATVGGNIRYDATVGHCGWEH